MTETPFSPCTGAETGGEPSTAAARKLVLVVDDDPDLLEYVAEVVRLAGYRVVTAIDGIRGLELLGRERPDLVLLDMMLPGMSGDEILDRLAQEKGGRPPVIVMTAAGHARERALAHRNPYYLPKPFDPTLLMATIETALEMSEGRGGDGEPDDDGGEPGPA